MVAQKTPLKCHWVFWQVSESASWNEEQSLRFQGPGSYYWE